jgi:glyoxylate/hydroxypyruvate reductase
MRTISLDSKLRDVRQFRDVLRAQNLGFQVVVSSDDVRRTDVEVAVIWRSVPDYLRSLPNLKLVLICGSGVDHIIHDTTLSRSVPLVRLVDPFLRDHVSAYVGQAIVNHLEWRSRRDDSLGMPRSKPTIGVMGLGLVGEATAKKLLEMGFEVCGWVRLPGPRTVEQVYVGNEGLAAFARRSEILVCQLPLTDETRGILNLGLFRLLPEGAYLINVGRGGHLNEADLLTALESGNLCGACLDVFDVEPLPAKHWFRSHPRITVTPHVAGMLNPETQAKYASHIIGCFYRGDVLEGVVNFRVCY